MGNKIMLTVLALMCLIGSMSVVAAGKETRLNVYPNMELCMPSISGNIITFSELMGESTQMYDLSSGKQIGLSTDESGSGASISGNNIVWFQGDNQIMLYNTVTKRTTSLLSGYSPAIYGNIITYGWNSCIYTYDISTKNTNLISVSGDSPQIYKKSIVYTDSGNVYIYDLSTKKQSLINIGASPGIYGDVVVWVYNGNIYMRNIATHKTTQITANGVSGDPKIYGNNIVFDTDLYSGNNYYNNIYMYSISSGKITQITKSNCAFQPAISGNKIVYVDFRNANTQDIDFKDLFIYDLTSKLAKPTGIITANVTSGTHPLTVFFSFRENGDMPTSYLWNFGDGITSTHAWTATHTYTKAGIYTVSLKVTNSAGSNTATKTKYITVK